MCKNRRSLADAHVWSISENAASHPVSAYPDEQPITSQASCGFVRELRQEKKGGYKGKMWKQMDMSLSQGGHSPLFFLPRPTKPFAVLGMSISRPQFLFEALPLDSGPLPPLEGLFDLGDVSLAPPKSFAADDCPE